ncbi:thiol peroxidase [Lacicoccus qingdaonensis]|uniref:Thiol peroxidase n=1 Tax=Lacicoccus qingdaonensis TaxID=576118 RepID=A0A1G9E131_9BACL|nr:thiol peroxidase [Salinicoccus qingdaonensis]SDK69770.1 thiol peroxidase (atypical 2-Cys peroxiredoxin) [Salinicoccus qingdaonensis]
MVEVTFQGNPVTVSGNEVKVGDTAPDFTVLNNSLEEVSLSDYKGKKKLISVVPSLDTGLCSTQTKKFNEDAGSVDNAVVITISNDLPFAQAKWCANEGIDNAITLSDHKDLSFGKNYGTVMDELRLQARSVFVIDENDKVVHVEYVSEGTNPPDYDAAVDALKSL